MEGAPAVKHTREETGDIERAQKKPRTEPAGAAAAAADGASSSSAPSASASVAGASSVGTDATTAAAAAAPTGAAAVSAPAPAPAAPDASVAAAEPKVRGPSACCREALDPATCSSSLKHASVKLLWRALAAALTGRHRSRGGACERHGGEERGPGCIGVDGERCRRR